jgi:DNA-binding NarL/FixJ family response regulator
MSTASGGNPAISVVIIDAQDVVHAGIESWLTGSERPIKIVGNYTDPTQFIADHPIATTAVDVVLFALQYERQGPEFNELRKLCQAGHRVVVYSFLVSDEVILSSLDAGAVSYVAKWDGGDQLRRAIYAASTDSPYVAPRMAKTLLNCQTVGRPCLSQREREVLIEWFKTESKEAVAEKLSIGPSTVRTHLQRARAKYAAAGRPAPTKAALMARAVQDGILSLDEL